ncbi:MAG: MFS transporter [Chloroflexi bacterium]|nr:MAG: MFS transporter [Chloroflexota bacterium]
MRQLQTLRQTLAHPIVRAFYLPSMLLAIAAGLLVPIMPLYVNTFGISYWLVGLVLSMENIGIIIGDVPAGVLVQRLGNRLSMLIGVLLILIFTLGLFWAQTIVVVIMLRLVSGMGKSLFNVARHTYLADNIYIAKRGRAIAMFGGIHRFGSFIGPAVAGTIAVTAGLRAPFLLYVALGALSMALIWAFLHHDNSPTATIQRQHQPQQRVRIRDVMRQHRSILVSAGSGALFAQMLRAGRRVILPLYAADVLGLDAQAIGFIISLGALIDMVLFYPAGWLMDHRGRKYAIVPPFILQSLGMALIPFTADFSGLLAAAMLMGFGNGLSAGTMMTLGSDLAPADTRGEFLGVWRLIGDTGATGGPVIVGGIADVLTLGASALALALAGLTGAAIFAFRVPETLKRRPKTPITA